MTFPTTPHSPPSRSQGQRQPSAGCLAAQTQALFQKHRLLPLSPSSTKPTCQIARWKVVGVGEGRGDDRPGTSNSWAARPPVVFSDSGRPRPPWSQGLQRTDHATSSARLASLTLPASVKAAGSLLNILRGQYSLSPGHSKQTDEDAHTLRPRRSGQAGYRPSAAASSGAGCGSRQPRLQYLKTRTTGNGHSSARCLRLALWHCGSDEPAAYICSHGTSERRWGLPSAEGAPTGKRLYSFTVLLPLWDKWSRNDRYKLTK